MVALALTALLALLVLVQIVRELWAFRRLARIDGFRAEAAAAHATADRDAALGARRAGSRASTPAAPSCAGTASGWPSSEDAVLDADALLELDRARRSSRRSTPGRAARSRRRAAPSPAPPR